MKKRNNPKPRRRECGNDIDPTIDELAREVLAGNCGFGAARREVLGDKYDAVQTRVNEIVWQQSHKEPKGLWVFVFVVLAVLIAVALACGLIFSIPRNAADPFDPSDRFGVKAEGIEAIAARDRVTGVYYLYVIKDGDIAVTPLLNVDGLPLCVDDANHGDIESALSDVRANIQREMRGEL